MFIGAECFILTTATNIKKIRCKYIDTNLLKTRGQLSSEIVSVTTDNVEQSSYYDVTCNSNLVLFWYLIIGAVFHPYMYISMST
jgi:hypothetical protein